jgi:hypothetical protein
MGKGGAVDCPSPATARTAVTGGVAASSLRHPHPHIGLVACFELRRCQPGSRVVLGQFQCPFSMESAHSGTAQTRTNTNPYDTKAIAVGRSGCPFSMESAYSGTIHISKEVFPLAPSID